MDFLIFQRAESSKQDCEVAEPSGQQWGVRLGREAELPREVREARSHPGGQVTGALRARAWCILAGSSTLLCLEVMARR